MDSIFSEQTEDFKDLIKKMLELDPRKRISVAEALEHKYFNSSPTACLPLELPLPIQRTEEIDAFTDSD